ncbi:MAG TPA: ATP-binding cassette domain-containing protein [Gemmatimonadaceae bacterium]|nr:ATP-binding cassette domain-containing protein [Gemmatimonadaceae bacterium]
MTSTFVYDRRETLLDIENVSVTLDGVPVLRDVSARVRNVVRPGMSQGQIVGLLGPSGVGKTTLFKVLAGLLAPDEGEVLVGPGRVPATPGLVGVVAQSYPLLEHRTVMSNLVVAGRQAGLGARAARDAARQYLDAFGLAGHGDRYPIQLSGGQRQRAAIAQQLICSEHYLVMDEPFSGLDVVAVDGVQRMLLGVATRHEHNTILLVTHDVSAAVAVCDTIWLMGRERDPATGTPIPGARIVEEIDLIELDLCWHPDVASRPAYAELVRRIKEKFREL